MLATPVTVLRPCRDPHLHRWGYPLFCPEQLFTLYAWFYRCVFLLGRQALALAGMMWKHMSRKTDLPRASWGVDGAARRRLSQSIHIEERGVTRARECDALAGNIYSSSSRASALTLIVFLVCSIGTLIY